MKLKEKTDCKHYTLDECGFSWCNKLGGDVMCNGCRYYRKVGVK